MSTHEALTRHQLNELRWGARLTAQRRVKVTLARHPVHVTQLDHTS